MMNPTETIVLQTASKRPQWVGKPAGLSHMGNLQAIAYVAVTVFILAYSALMGPAAIVLLYLLWLPYAVTHKGRRVRHGLKNNLLPALYVGLCLCSVLWSDYRSVTARAALESASMLVCTLTISQIVSLKSFIKGLNIGVALVLTATLISGNYGMDYFSGTFSLVGLFGSKNQVGLFADIGILGSLVYLFSKEGIGKKILFVPVPFGLSMICLYMSKSATALAAILIVLTLCFSVRVLSRFPKPLRSLTTGVAVFIGVIILAAAIGLGLQEAGLSLLGKDSTLTGRTYLWGEGLRLGLERPFLGDGFAAFWVPGRPSAEEYWFHFGITGRTGFHFHNMFIETFVEIGFVGLAIIVLLYISNLIASLRYVMRNSMDMLGFFALGVALIFIIRAMVEVDVLVPFGIGPLLFFIITPYLNQHRLMVENKAALAPTDKALKGINS